MDLAMYWVHRILVYIVVGVVALGKCSKENTNGIEYVHVEKISGTITRNRRSAALDFPAHTVFRFKMPTGSVVLNLERSAYQRQHLPMYTIEPDTGIQYRDTARQENFALYQDLRNGASVLVKCAQGGPEDVRLFGEFSHKGSHYQIEPLTTRHRIKRDRTNMTQSQNHVIKRQVLPYGDFYGDALTPPAIVGVKSARYSTDVYPDVEEKVPGVHVLQKRRPKNTRHAKQTTTERKRRRRRSTNVLYIEYLVVADYRNFQRWKNKVSVDTGEDGELAVLNAMSEFYRFVVNGIDLRFRSASGTSGPEVRVVFTQLMVSTTSDTSPWTEHNRLGGGNVDDAGVLYEFAQWKNGIKQYLPRHDHAALFTGYNMATYTSTNPIGLGYLNLICHSAWAVSEIEETYNAITVHIAAHELGHNIGTRHDGSNNGCNPTKWYLMAPRLPTVYKAESRNNPWKFSSCSQANIRQYLNSLGKGNCLTNVPDPTLFAREDIVPPGITYSPDEQCNMTYGDGAVLCREKLYGQYDSLCYAMQCKKIGATQCEGRYFPFDGTPCGDKKWCQAGSCVWSEEAPSAQPSCPFGDDPSVDCTTGGYCDDYVYKNVFCCNACKKTTTTTTTTFTSTVTSSSSSTVTSFSSSTVTSSSPTDSTITASTSTTPFSTTSAHPSSTVVTSSSPSATTTSAATTSVTQSSTTSTKSPSTPTTLSSTSATSTSATSSSPSSTTATQSSSTDTTVSSTISTPMPSTTSNSSTQSSPSPTSSSSSSPSPRTDATSTTTESNVTSTYSTESTHRPSTITTSILSTQDPVSTVSSTPVKTTSSQTSRTSTVTAITTEISTEIPNTTTSVTLTSFSTENPVVTSGSTKTQKTSTQTTVTSKSTLKTTPFSVTTSVTTPEASTSPVVLSTTSVTRSPSTPVTTSDMKTPSTSTTDPTDTTTTTSTTGPPTTTATPITTGTPITTETPITTGIPITTGTPITTEPKLELSVKLKSMISLFVATAIVV